MTSIDILIDDIDSKLKEARAMVDKLEIARSVFYAVKTNQLVDSGSSEEIVKFIQGIIRA